MDTDARRTAMERAHAQATHQLRLDWGPTGAAAISKDADIAVVVDVLSFTTTLSIATRQGTTVYPFRWKDDRAAAFAAEHDTVLALGRHEARHPAGRSPSSRPESDGPTTRSGWRPHSTNARADRS